MKKLSRFGLRLALLRGKVARVELHGLRCCGYSAWVIDRQGQRRLHPPGNFNTVKLHQAPQSGHDNGTRTGQADLARVEGRVPGRGSVLVSLDAIRREVEVAGAEGAGGKDDALAARIRELAARGLSRRQIEEEVFGYTGGAAYQKVREVLGEEGR